MDAFDKAHLVGCASEALTNQVDTMFDEAFEATRRVREIKAKMAERAAEKFLASAFSSTQEF